MMMILVIIVIVIMIIVLVCDDIDCDDYGCIYCISDAVLSNNNDNAEVLATMLAMVLMRPYVCDHIIKDKI